MKTTLGEVIDGLDVKAVLGDGGVSITDVCSDSRQVTEGSLFACVKGSRFDGHSFAQDVVDRGASVIVAERRVSTSVPVTQVVVDNVREALAHISSRFYGMPSEDLTVIGVTGTNGKTTTVHYLQSILEAAGHRAGIIGTLGHWIGDSLRKDTFTTPEAPGLHRYMKEMLDKGMGFCVMEVSSHAIALSRVNHVSFDAVCFTNLTRDHLDFHGGFEDYKKTKMKLFGIDDAGCWFGGGRKAVVNMGDAVGRQIHELSPLPRLSYCVDGDADVRGQLAQVGGEGTKVKVTHGGRTTVIETSLGGRMNAENALAACAVSFLIGIDEEAIQEGIAGVRTVPGRMEIIDGPGRQAIVDYAHTPDALRRLLTDVREIWPRRLICVFGCGGDRDQGKRPEMARIASDLSDLVIVTSDNPRTEDPLKIIEDVVRGFAEGADYTVIPDRAEAIRQAVDASDEGDVIVIAGKGHETYQIVGDTRMDFDDREAVRKAFGAIANAKA